MVDFQRSPWGAFLADAVQQWQEQPDQHQIASWFWSVVDVRGVGGDLFESLYLW